MSNVEPFPFGAQGLTEYEALIAAAPTAIEAIPGAVYVCDHDGWLVCCNTEAVELWGRTPNTGEGQERFCGSHLMFLPNGAPLAHADCPMAAAVRSGEVSRNVEVIIERPDGSRRWALVNIRPLRDRNGDIQGAINCFQDITAHKEIETEIRHKSEDLEDFFENSAIGLHIVSGEGIIVRANRAELELLGYSADEYVGRHIAEFHADARAIGEILQKLSCGEKLDRHPARLRARDGAIKHVLITSNSRFENGKFVSTRCFTSDVTDLYAAQTAWRASESRLAATYQAATIGIAEADAQGRLVQVNDAICRMLAHPREDLLAMNFLDYTHEDDRGEDAAQYARQVAGEIDHYVIRKKAIRGDGGVIYLDVFSSSVLDADGRFLYGVRILQDVTEAKLLEDRLRASERHMRDLLEALPAAVYTTDAAGKITFFNKAAVEMSGREPGPGDQWCVTWKLYNTDGSPLPHDQCPMAIALRENRPVRGAEAIAERPDGVRIPFIPFPTPLHNGDGNLIGAINMLVDISERKQAENRQRVLIDELNHRVKNTLATVQSLAAQTARHADGIKDFVPRFEIRLTGLARAHDLLSRRHWEDAPLDGLIHELMAPLAGERRVEISGPAVSLNPRAALSLTMAVNELATNAVKYGALASEQGRLSLCWRIVETLSGPVLKIEWREHGGPPVAAPSRRGFGSRLMQRCIEGDLAGQFELAFDPEGVACTMNIPMARLRDA